MNKLKQFREDYFANLVKEAFGQEVSEQMYDKEKSLLYDMFKEGFNLVIALDLPVKFYLWAKGPMDFKGKDIIRSKFDERNNKNSEKELYQYWIENIYKP